MTTPQPTDDSLERVAAEVRVCPKCDLCRSRTNAVPGDGPDHPEILFIGEAPGLQEDRQGRPFVGPAGQFLDELLAKINLRRADCFIANVVKCRPPDNRKPTNGEIVACAPYLTRQIALLQPLLIVTLGNYSMAKFLPGESISRIHGRLRNINGQLVLPLYHPAAALHRAELRNTLFQDFAQIPLALAAARAHSSDLPPMESPAKDNDPPQQMSLF